MSIIEEPCGTDGRCATPDSVGAGRDVPIR